MPRNNVLSSDSDDDAPIGELGGQSDSASEPDWVKSWEPSQRSDGPSPALSTGSSSDGGWGGPSDEEDVPLANLAPGRTGSDSSESGSAAEGTTKVRKKKLTGVPSKVQLSVPGKGKVKTTNMLLQIDNPELDLSGDTGAVGRFNAKRRSVHLDLKGVTYGGSLVKSHTLCTVVVNDGKAEVKEAFNSFVHLAKTADYSDKEEIEGADFDNFDDFELSEGEGDGSAAKGKGKGAGGKGGAKKRASAKQPATKVHTACESFFVFVLFSIAGRCSAARPGRSARRNSRRRSKVEQAHVLQHYAACDNGHAHKTGASRRVNPAATSSIALDLRETVALADSCQLPRLC